MEPQVNRIVPDQTVKNIVYAEDFIRRSVAHTSSSNDVDKCHFSVYDFRVVLVTSHKGSAAGDSHGTSSVLALHPRKQT